MKLRIKYWRNYRRMTQQGLADKIGKARSMIPAYEAGTVGVSSVLLYLIAKALDVSVNDLYVPEEEEHTAQGEGNHAA